MRFSIWSEGYRVTEGCGRAFLHGSEEGSDFKDAVKRFAETRPDFREFFNEENLTYWGCRLFPNEESAGKSFG